MTMRMTSFLRDEFEIRRIRGRGGWRRGSWGREPEGSEFPWWSVEASLSTRSSRREIEASSKKRQCFVRNGSENGKFYIYMYKMKNKGRKWDYIGIISLGKIARRFRLSFLKIRMIRAKQQFPTFPLLENIPKVLIIISICNLLALLSSSGNCCTISARVPIEYRHHDRPLKRLIKSGEESRNERVITERGYRGIN